MGCSVNSPVRPEKELTLKKQLQKLCYILKDAVFQFPHALQEAIVLGVTENEEGKRTLT